MKFELWLLIKLSLCLIFTQLESTQVDIYEYIIQFYLPYHYQFDHKSYVNRFLTYQIT